MNKKYVSMALGTLASTAMIVPAFAENTPTTNNSMHDSNRMMRRGGEQEGGERGQGKGNGQMMRPVVMGTVTSISGNTITLSGTAGMTSSTTPKTTYTVDITNAKVMKSGTTSTVAVGDTLMVSGTLTGTNVVATMVRDGLMMGRGDGAKHDALKNDASAMKELQGNGQPVVAGTITAINGTTLTITNKSNVTYTAEASGAKVLALGATSTLASVKVGDTVVIQGTINGNSITVSTVIDNGTPKTKADTEGQGENQGKIGFFAGLGGFFGRMFGF